MFLGSFRAMKRKQLFWAALCALSLLEVVSGDPDTNTTSAPETSATDTTFTTTPLVTTPGASDGDTTKAGPADTKPSSPAGTSAPPSTKTVSINETTLTTVNMTEAPSSAPTTVRSCDGGNETEPRATNISSTQQPEVSSLPNVTLPNTTLKPVWTTTTGSTKHTVSSVTTSPGNEISSGTEIITCHNVKHVTKPHVICLQLNASYTCDHFKMKMGRRLWQLLCNDSSASLHPASPCRIELAKSEVKPYCMLLILGDTADAEGILNHLKNPKSDLKELGIESHQKEEIWKHQDFSRKTLIALVTSGLSVAILGLAAYFLMKRRSWSPTRERLGEDPYYMENSSQGNTLISVGAHEQPEPQEKPNLNGGAQENGTGQTASKNGRSARPRVLADTEM
ncbi:hematopoietic progenitor cell antigen CD34 isoform X1 [Alligator sinensis]|uniref:Hematopoietic progenitor cell antigen CD34 isoform X1 n=2 Tax=Alligator sinensis TaxID=38654 RepID=A0A1U7S544_ALLSI|nr:hematopoietic progenitor cell antigen CD34 isoform X1 [Alligator sinensis]